MLLTGHEGEVFSVCAGNDGECLASAGFDQKILLWNIYGECENYATLKGHKGSIMEGGGILNLILLITQF
jgi:Prp8 binding protein